MPKNFISCRPGSYGSFALAAYEMLPSIGVHHVEIDCPPTQEAAEGLADLLEDEDVGVKVGTLVFQINVEDPDIVEKFRQAIQFAPRFTPKCIFSSASSKNLKLDLGYEVLRKIGDLAQEQGLYVALETHPPFCTNADEMLRTLQAVNHPAIRINFDTANIYYYNPLDPGDGIREMQKVIEHIGAIHLKQTDGAYHSWYFPALGDERGVVDFKQVFEILNGAGFYGPFTLELEGTFEGEVVTLETAHERVKQSVDHLRAIGVMD
jgi:inosose dehydratase